MIKDYFIHETSVADEPSIIGSGTQIWHYSHLMAGVTIGEKCNVGQNVFIGRSVKIGNGVKIQNNVSVFEGVTLEDNVFCGPSCVFTNIKTPRSHIPRKSEFAPTLVKKGATIGANATIMCGTTIGTYALIGASALVTKDVPDYALVYGVPARLKGWVCECGLPLEFGKQKQAECSGCGKRYNKEKNSISPL